jgi:hypothetical protein
MTFPLVFPAAMRRISIPAPFACAPAAQCEARDTNCCALLDRIEALLDRGEARAAMRRLGRWAAGDSRPLGARGVSLVARLALELGRADLAYAHAMRSRTELPECEEKIGAALRASSDRAAGDLVVERAGAWFRVGSEPPVSLERRPRLRRLLAALLESPQGLTPAELFARVWPERRAPRAVIHNRIDVSLARLRSLGLRDCIVREPGRIALLPGLEVVS